MRFKVAHKASTGYIIILALIIAAAAILYNAAQSIRTHVDHFVNYSFPALHHIDEVQLAVDHMEISAFGLYGYTLSPQAFAEDLARQEERITTALASESLLAQASVDGLDSPLADFRLSITNLQAELSKSSVDWDAARDELSGLTESATLLGDIIGQIKADIGAEAEDSANLIVTELDYQIALIIALILMTVMVTLLALIATQRLITRPVLSLASDLSEVSSNYNLTHQVTRLSNDEVGEVGSQLSSLLAEFRGALEQVQNAAGGTRSSVSTLLNVTESSDNRIESLISQIGTLMGDMEQLQQHIETQVERSESAATSAQSGADEVDKGATQMQHTANSIDKLAGEVDRASTELLELHQTSEKVSSVVGTIAEIAEQTNLLALNAAIEAARAGESGRGFAVVADEVRTLATRTHQSTAEINTMLEVLVSSINSVVKTMQSGKDQASESVTLGKEMVSSLNQLITIVTELSATSHQVALETGDAGQKVKLLGKQVSHFSEIGVSVSEDSQKVRSEAQELYQQGEGLQSTVERFKI